MVLANWLSMIGGIGLFLYGMNLMGTSIEKIAGSGLEKTLEKLTNNRFKGLLLGVGVTAVIQSSSATSIMVVGFINAGIMKLTQGVAVMMGANIGTTVTGQILRLGDLSENAALAFLSPSTFAPLCIAVGAFIRLLARRERKKLLSTVLIGFGTLFIGMSMIESGMEPLNTSVTVQRVLLLFENPLLGVLLGIAVVSVLQSASASVGMLQAISTTGSLTFSIAAPIVLGMNIGKFVPVIMASAGTNKNAKRAVLVNCMICTFGAAAFLAVMYLYQGFVGFSFWNDTVNRGAIADFNTLFNIATTALMFPLAGFMVNLSGRILHDEGMSRMENALAQLDEHFLPTPTVALQQAHNVVCAMADTCLENYRVATDLLSKYNRDQASRLEENESFLDQSESALGDYVTRINTHELNYEMTRASHETIMAVCDFERIGDYCVNIAEIAQYHDEYDIQFSAECIHELQYLFQATERILRLTEETYRQTSRALAMEVEPLEETVDSLLEVLKTRHTERLERGECDVQRGISLMNLFSNIERISDHCSNVAIHTLQRLSPQDDFDAHHERSEMHKGMTESYRALFGQYRQEYIMPLLAGSKTKETGR